MYRNCWKILINQKFTCLWIQTKINNSWPYFKNWCKLWQCCLPYRYRYIQSLVQLTIRCTGLFWFYLETICWVMNVDHLCVMLLQPCESETKNNHPTKQFLHLIALADHLSREISGNITYCQWCFGSVCRHFHVWI